VRIVANRRRALKSNRHVSLLDASRYGSRAMRYRRHVFVCTNTRPVGGKPSCGARGGIELVAALQRAVASSSLVGDVAVTPCGCLGPCFDGPVAVVYPDGAWVAGASDTDVPEIATWLAGGELPERLSYDWPTDED
jgi:(2Fe-2S) ferredoxin